MENVVGTSAGAIAASLVACGYTGEEIETELKYVDFKKFMQKSNFGKLGLFGNIVNLFLSYGIYKADYFENWLSELLKKKDKYLFRDIKTESDNEKYKYKFQAIASDLTDHRILILPQDLKLFGIDPDNFEIAKAVRMSMGIPLYYEPFRLRDTNGKVHLIADGGLLSNYPVWLLDDGTNNPPWPTFGMKFKDDGTKKDGTPISRTKNIIDYSKSLITTMIEANDNFHISHSSGDFQRSIMIPTKIHIGQESKTIRTTDFDITPDEGMALANNGRHAAEQFLQEWSFEGWKSKYRRA